MFLLQTSRGVIRTSVFECPISKQFWSDLGSHIFDSANVVHSFSLKDIIFYYDCKTGAKVSGPPPLEDKRPPWESTKLSLAYVTVTSRGAAHWGIHTLY